MNDETFDSARPPKIVEVNCSNEQTAALSRRAATGGARPQRVAYPAGMDRFPPHSDEAEQGVLGCILLEPTQCLSACEECGVTPLWFYDLRNRILWQCFDELYRGGQAIDSITVQQLLRDTDQLRDAGGVAYWAGLPDRVPSAANLPYYLDILEQKFTLRRLVGTCMEAIDRAYEQQDEVDELVDELERNILAVSEGRAQQKEQAIRDIMPAVVDTLEKNFHRGSARLDGLTTGIPYLDKVFGGLGGKKRYIVLAARPNVGKSRLAMQFALWVALYHKWWTPELGPDGKVVRIEDEKTGKREEEPESTERKIVVPLKGGKRSIVDAHYEDVPSAAAHPKEQGKIKWIEHTGLPVGIFSMEMDAESVVEGLLFQEARADIQRWRTGFPTKEDAAAIERATPRIANAKIYIDDECRLPVEAFCARARRMVRQLGVRLLVVDYVQLLQVQRRNYRQERRQELEYISGCLQKLCKELNVPVVVIAQMNREHEKEGSRAPRLSDLKECDAIAADADVVAFLYEAILKEAAQEEFDQITAQVFGDSWSTRPTRIDLLKVKDRHGPNNQKCQLMFQKGCTLFVDYNAWKKEHGFKAPAKGERKGKAKEDDIL